MRLLRLIVLEILYRKANFALGLLSVIVAVGCFVCGRLFLEEYDRQTERLADARQKETTTLMATLQDDIRKSMLRMGFNMMILPKAQSLAEFHAGDKETLCMPEEYGQRLKKRRVRTINHVLPTLQRKIDWTEKRCTVNVMGVSGEVYIQSPLQLPLLEAIPANGMVVGEALAMALELTVGQEVTLAGRRFTITGIQPSRGTRDDSTLLINLNEAQEIFDKKGLINVILALECECGDDTLSKIRNEIASVLPDTQVVELSLLASARAEARRRAAAVAEKAAGQERVSREAVRQEKVALFAILNMVLTCTAVIGMALLMTANVRERRVEIAAFRAMGFRVGAILVVFLGKAMVLGVLGAMLGYVGGALATAWYCDSAPQGPLIQTRLLVTAMAGSLGLVCAASALPAILAARTDPATILREE